MDRYQQCTKCRLWRDLKTIVSLRHRLPIARKKTLTELCRCTDAAKTCCRGTVDFLITRILSPSIALHRRNRPSRFKKILRGIQARIRSVRPLCKKKSPKSAPQHAEIRVFALKRVKVGKAWIVRHRW